MNLTLDEMWNRCLAMWRWIVAQIEAGSDLQVTTLKTEWLKANDPDAMLSSECYFCQWVCEHPSLMTCSGCPGTLVDPQFDCTDPDYHWREHPQRFLVTLEELNIKRKAAP